MPSPKSIYSNSWDSMKAIVMGDIHDNHECCDTKSYHASTTEVILRYHKYRGNKFRYYIWFCDFWQSVNLLHECSRLTYCSCLLEIRKSCTKHLSLMTSIHVHKQQQTESSLYRIHDRQVYEWVGTVFRTSRHIIEHFRDESFQAITCTGINNQ